MMIDTGSFAQSDESMSHNDCINDYNYACNVV